MVAVGKKRKTFPEVYDLQLEKMHMQKTLAKKTSMLLRTAGVIGSDIKAEVSLGVVVGRATLKCFLPEFCLGHLPRHELTYSST